jgi:hypothetical protein
MSRAAPFRSRPDDPGSRCTVAVGLRHRRRVTFSHHLPTFDRMLAAFRREGKYARDEPCVCPRKPETYHAEAHCVFGIARSIDPRESIELGRGRVEWIGSADTGESIERG